MIGRTVCCLYCKKQFQVNGKQRWHNCIEAVKARTKLQNEKFRKKYKEGGYLAKSSKKLKTIRKTWKKCIDCGYPTPNHFGRCSSCISKIEQFIDLDLMIAFESGGGSSSGKRMGSRIHGE